MRTTLIQTGTFHPRRHHTLPQITIHMFSSSSLPLHSKHLAIIPCLSSALVTHWSEVCWISSPSPLRPFLPCSALRISLLYGNQLLRVFRRFFRRFCHRLRSQWCRCLGRSIKNWTSPSRALRWSLRGKCSRRAVAFQLHVGHRPCHGPSGIREVFKHKLVRLSLFGLMLFCCASTVVDLKLLKRVPPARLLYVL